MFSLEGWEVRLFGSRQFGYFVTRGFWHLQLWHSEARISILSPSRLTRGFYEGYPHADWKVQAPSYSALVGLLTGSSGVPFLDPARVRTLETCLVDDVVRMALSERGQPQ